MNKTNVFLINKINKPDNIKDCTYDTFKMLEEIPTLDDTEKGFLNIKEKSLNLKSVEGESLSSSQFKENKKKPIKLPSIWSLAEEFSKSYPYLKYCTHYHSFYLYSLEELIWKECGKTDAHNLIIKWLKSTYNDSYKEFQPRRLEDLLIILQSETRFSMLKEKTEVNKNGFLIPFKNGVLNSVTKEFIKHEPELYCTHIINQNYNKEENIVNTPLSLFLSQFVNFNPQRLNLLRAFLNIIFTNNTRYQLALYMYGPGGTGKSTLINILLYLIGPEASYSTNLTSLNSRFGLSNISHKILMVINDMTHFKGKEPKILKEIITGDKLQSEKKYKETINISPHLVVAITSNSIWELVNPTGGINRRIVYFPSDYVPESKDLELFQFTLFGEAEGKIVQYLPGFINWILSCPAEYLSSLRVGGENLSKFINPNNLISSHHLDTWIESYLTKDEKAKTPVGNKKSGLNSLYGNYLHWCSINNIEPPIKINRFSDLLLDSLNTLNWENVQKKRSSSGYFIVGIKIKDEENFNSNIEGSVCVQRTNRINLGYKSDELNFNND